MPELPEVETVRRSLEKHLLGEEIQSAEIFLPRLIQRMSEEEFARRIERKRIEKLARTGKYLRFILEGDMELIFHLRMTGQLVFVPKEEVETRLVPYARVRFLLSGGAQIVYADLRTLGTIYLLKREEKNFVKGLAAMGPEPLTEAFTADYLKQRLKNRRVKIKSFLLKQEEVGGLGNIYVDEALFLAGIYPERLGQTLTEKEINRLHGAINRGIAEGIASGGTSVRNYVDGEGKKGHHQEELNVYQREGKPCNFCGTPIERIVVGGRGTRFCPHCQPRKGT